jgi:regulator of replication initiation timing
VSPQETVEQLNTLKEVLTRYIDEERTRLTLERTFLESVLESSLGGAVERSNSLDEAAALQGLRQLLG